MTIIVELTEEILEAYNTQDSVLLHDCNKIALSITKDMRNARVERVGAKKHATYIFSARDIERINEGVEYLFYDGPVKIKLLKTAKEDIK